MITSLNGNRPQFKRPPSDPNQFGFANQLPDSEEWLEFYGVRLLAMRVPVQDEKTEACFRVYAVLGCETDQAEIFSTPDIAIREYVRQCLHAVVYHLEGVFKGENDDRILEVLEGHVPNSFGYLQSIDQRMQARSRRGRLGNRPNPNQDKED